jgi:hypothetical protein
MISCLQNCDKINKYELELVCWAVPHGRATAHCAITSLYDVYKRSELVVGSRRGAP